MKQDMKLAKALIDRMPKGERKSAMESKIVEQTQKVSLCFKCILLHRQMLLLKFNVYRNMHTDSSYLC